MDPVETLRMRLRTLEEDLRRVHPVRGRTFAEMEPRARRLLPRGLRGDARALAEACEMLDNPKLVRQLDMEALRAAETRLSRHLGTVDLADRRRGFWLSVAGGIAFNLLLVIAAFVGWLVWSGQL